MDMEYVGVKTGPTTRYASEKDDNGHKCLAIQQGNSVVLLRKADADRIPAFAERFAE